MKDYGNLRKSWKRTSGNFEALVGGLVTEVDPTLLRIPSSAFELVQAGRDYESSTSRTRERFSPSRSVFPWADWEACRKIPKAETKRIFRLLVIYKLHFYEKIGRPEFRYPFLWRQRKRKP